jgi:hypothetical protein
MKPRVLSIFLWFFVRVCHRVTVLSPDNVPAQGGALLVSNPIRLMRGASESGLQCYPVNRELFNKLQEHYNLQRFFAGLSSSPPRISWTISLGTLDILMLFEEHRHRHLSPIFDRFYQMLTLPF